MNIFKRISITLLLLVIIGIAFRGWIYRNLVSYESMGPRRNYGAIDSSLVKYIDTKPSNEESDIEEIINKSLNLTSQQLNFTTGHNFEDPNKLIKSKNANCIGYSAFFSTTCNQLLEKSNLNNEWSAQPEIGQLYFLGINVHPYFKSSFFKDHDFVIVRNKITGQTLGVDPSLNDYSGIRYVRLRDKNGQ